MKVSKINDSNILALSFHTEGSKPFCFFGFCFYRFNSIHCPKLSVVVFGKRFIIKRGE